MLGMRRALIAIGAAMLVLAACSSAIAKERTSIARNILPSGQFQLNSGPAARAQAQMYDALTPLFDHVTSGDLITDFKSEALGVGTDGPTTTESVPYAGRHDRARPLQRPARQRADRTTAASGRPAGSPAEDRGLLLEQARYNSRVAAIDAPGLTRIGLISGLQNFEPERPDRARGRRKQTTRAQAPRQGGPRACCATSTPSSEGINAYLRQRLPPTRRGRATTSTRVNALKGQFVGQGGGDEARRTEFLAGLQDELGLDKGLEVFNDLRQYNEPEQRRPRSTASSPTGTIPQAARRAT